MSSEYDDSDDSRSSQSSDETIQPGGSGETATNISIFALKTDKACNPPASGRLMGTFVDFVLELGSELAMTNTAGSAEKVRFLFTIMPEIAPQETLQRVNDVGYENRLIQYLTRPVSTDYHLSHFDNLTT